MKMNDVMKMLADDLLVNSKAEDEFTLREYMAAMEERTGIHVSEDRSRGILLKMTNDKTLSARKIVVGKTSTTVWRPISKKDKK